MEPKRLTKPVRYNSGTGKPRNIFAYLCRCARCGGNMGRMAKGGSLTVNALLCTRRDDEGQFTCPFRPVPYATAWLTFQRSLEQTFAPLVAAGNRDAKALVKMFSWHDWAASPRPREYAESERAERREDGNALLQRLVESVVIDADGQRLVLYWREDGRRLTGSQTAIMPFRSRAGR